jgi:uncharacterized membrane protein YoaK (UPF0700 family)
LLLLLTLVTGLVDAVSILALGRVFVANMTGNVVFVGFALVGAPGFSLSASLSALAGFLIGAFGAGLFISRTAPDRGVLLRVTVCVELLLLLIAVGVSQTQGSVWSGGSKIAIAGIIAIAMGMQNAMARRLAVPDITTTVLTMTLTGLAADARSGNGSAVVRRLLALGTMLVGAVIGALLVDHHEPAAALAIAAGILALVTFFAIRCTRRPAAWRE